MNTLLYIKADKYSLTSTRAGEDIEFVVFSGPEPNVHICIDMYYDKYDAPPLTEVPELQSIMIGREFSKYQDAHTLDLSMYRDEKIMIISDLVVKPTLAEIAERVRNSTKTTKDNRERYSFEHIEYDVDILLDWDNDESRYFCMLASVLRSRKHASFTRLDKGLKITFANSSLANYWSWKIKNLKPIIMGIFVEDIVMTGDKFFVTHYDAGEREMKTTFMNAKELNVFLAFMAFLQQDTADTNSRYDNMVDNYMKNVANFKSIRKYSYIDRFTDMHRAILIDNDILKFSQFSRYKSYLNSFDKYGCLEEWKQALVYFLKDYGFTSETVQSVEHHPDGYRATERLIMTKCICDVKDATCIRHSDPIPLPENATFSMRYLHRMLYGGQASRPEDPPISKFAERCVLCVDTDDACSALKSVVEAHTIDDMVSNEMIDPRYSFMF